MGIQVVFCDRNYAPARTNQRRALLNLAACTLPLVVMLMCSGCASLPATPAAPAAPTSATAGATTIVAVAPPPAGPGMTLPQFLGLDKVFGGFRLVGQRIRNRLGSRFPGLESRPPIRSITDPANMGPEASPAVQAAAEAKAEEDKAPQKAKAIRYLASLGCGECYPDTEAALLAALEDCNEMIRYETVRGLRNSAGKACQCCRQNSCCSPKLLKKLYEMAYERDEAGCYLESSARVRRNARLAICGCGGVPSTPVELGDAPNEGPMIEEAQTAPPEGVPAEGAPVPAPPPPVASDIPQGSGVVQAENSEAEPGEAVEPASLTTEDTAETPPVTLPTAFLLPEIPATDDTEGPSTGSDDSADGE